MRRNEPTGKLSFAFVAGGHFTADVNSRKNAKGF